jgi:serine/threonine-protein kinase RsbW
MAADFSITVSNDYESLKKLCEAASEFLERSEAPFAASYATDLVLEEMVSNIIKYGYDDSRKHEIKISMEIKNGDLLVKLEDDGLPFDPTLAPVPDTDLPINERKIGGLGIHLVRNTSKNMAYRRENERNILEVTIPLKQEDAKKEKNGD